MSNVNMQEYKELLARSYALADVAAEARAVRRMRPTDRNADEVDVATYNEALTALQEDLDLRAISADALVREVTAQAVARASEKRAAQ
jgi:hypothetical protein